MKFKFLIILITILIFSAFIFIKPKQHNTNNISEETIPFTISKQIFYTGITPKNTTYSNNENWMLSISQYTDIALYITRNSKELNDSNTINSLYIDNFNFIKKPTNGIPALYYQNPLKFATGNFSNEYPIKTHLSYNILNFENKDNFKYYSSPNFFIDCSIPITLKYINSNIIKDFKLSNTETLFFNGSILKNSNFKLENLNTKFSFCINIITNDNKFYKKQIELTIPLKNSEHTLLDQNIYLEKETKLNFDNFSNKGL
ncbi:MAG: hypothetical protein J6J60_03260 [Clostridia bacterium]|nr:hypothetical protein [Clostridia bacterium]